jgi:hypothetical protein
MILHVKLRWKRFHMARLYAWCLWYVLTHRLEAPSRELIGERVLSMLKPARGQRP